MNLMDPELLWHGLGGGAIVASVVTLARLVLDYKQRHGDRRTEQLERRRVYQRDAEARLERVLQDRLTDADRRLERCLADVEAERSRRVNLERDFALLLQAHELLRSQFDALQTDHSELIGAHRLLLRSSARPGSVASH
jgi:hypothetical protein